MNLKNAVVRVVAAILLLWSFSAVSKAASDDLGLKGFDTLWVATENGLTPISQESLETGQAIFIDHLSAFAADLRSGNLWVATDDGRVLHLDTSGNFLQPAITLPSDLSRIEQISLSIRSDLVWLRAEERVLALDPATGAFTQFSVTARDIVAWEGQQSLVLSKGQLIQLDAVTGNESVMHPLDGVQEPKLVAGNPETGTWMVAGKESLLRVSHSTVPVVVQTHPLKNPRHLLLDESGNVWLAGNHRLVGISEAGVIFHDGNPFPGKGNGNGPRIMAMAADPLRDRVWLADNHQIIATDGSALPPLQGAAIKGMDVFVDRIPPEIEFVAPAAEGYYNDPFVPLNLSYSDVGSGVDTDSLELLRDALPWETNCEASTSSARCIGKEAIPDGYRTFAVTVADLLGNVSEPAELRFTIDTVPPEILLSAPEDGTLTNRISITVEGRLSEWADLRIDGEQVGISEEYAFAVSKRLHEGENTLALSATDRAGNEKTVTRTVIRDTIPPEITILSPNDGDVVDTRIVVVRGSVNEIATVHINGETVEVPEQGNFATSVALVEGINTITVRAVDAAGNSSLLVRSVELDTTPPEPIEASLIEVSEPDENGWVTISGLPGGLEPGSIVEILVPRASESGEGVLYDLIQVLVEPDGSFTTVVRAEDGVPLEVLITIRDENGRVSETITVDLDELPSHQGTLVGALKGEFSVDPTGAANYKLPIPVPKGAGGMQPDLALLYSSRAGAGQLGVGWSLSGLSLVSRCPHNPAIDGAVRGVRYDPEDRFCLDGQRLILNEGSGSYGKPGSEYHTEIASFQKIVAVGGTDETGPDGFTVKDKAGLIRHYGKHPGMPDGRMEIGELPVAGEWLISRIQDRFGNYIDFKHEQDAAKTESWLNRIRWYNTNDQLLGEVTFQYGNVAKSRDRYTHTGDVRRQTRRLDGFSISSREFNGSEMQAVGEYRLHYRESFRTGRDLLGSVEYCTASDQCLPKTILQYRDQPLEFGDLQSYYSFQREMPRFVDLDKDGRADPIWVDDGEIKFRVGTARMSSGLGIHEDVENFYTFLDADGDGYLDIAIPSGDGLARWNIHLWNKQDRNFERIPRYSFHGYAEDAQALPMALDVDGDGRTEILSRVNVKGVNGPVLVIYSFEDDSLVWTYTGFGVSDENPMHVVDINGDSRPDLLIEPRNCNTGLMAREGFTESDELVRKSCIASAGVLLNTGSGFGHISYGNPMEGYTGPAPELDLGFDIPDDPRDPGNPGDGPIPIAGLIVSDPAPEFEVHDISGEVDDFDPPMDCESTDPFPREPGVDPESHCEPPPTGERPDSWSFSWRPTYIKPADINGDGLTDIVRYIKEEKRWSVALNKGTYWDEVWVGLGMSLSDNEFAQAQIADVNGDGWPDMIAINDDYARLSLGSGEGFQNFTSRQLYSKKGFVAQDFDGDGNIDFGRMKDGYFKVAFNNGGAVDHLHNIINGYGETTRVRYASLNFATVARHRVYTGHIEDESGLDIGEGRQQPFMAPLRIVSHFSVDSGATSPIVTRYRYYGAQVDVSGRGFLGFREIAATNENTGIQTLNRHRQAFPFTGMVEASYQHVPDQQVVEIPPGQRDDIFDGPCVKRPQDCKDGIPKLTESAEDFPIGQVIAETVNTFEEAKGAHDPVTFGRYPYVSNTTTKSYDFHSGDLLKIESTSTTMGANGNATNIVTSTSGPGSVNLHEIVTNNHYTDDLGKWCLGRLDHSTVTHRWNGKSQIRESRFAYDMAGSCQLTDEILEPNGIALHTEYVHDGFGNVRQKIVRGHDGERIVERSTATRYDNSGRFVESRKNGLDHEETTTWDARFGVKTSHIGPNGLETRWEYDELGRMQRTITPSGAETQVTRAWCAEADCWSPEAAYRVLTTEPDGTVKHEYFDRMQRKIGTWTTDIHSRRYVALQVFDLRGRVIAGSAPVLASSPTRCWSYFEYDNLDRQVAQYTPRKQAYCSDTTLPTLESVQAVYANPPAGYKVDRTVHAGLTTWSQVAHGRVQSRTVYPNGWLAAVADHGKTAAISHDNLPPVLVEDGFALQTLYDYDAQGNTTDVTDPMGNVVHMDYDLLGRKRGMNDPDMGIWEYRYNDFGELVWQQDAKGQVVEMRYDALGRMKFRNEPEGTTTWQYDTAPGLDNGKGIGKLATVVGSDGYAAAYRYDDLGRVERQVELIDGELFEQAFEYDALGRLTDQYYPSLAVSAGADLADVADRLDANDTTGAGYHVRYQYEKGRLKTVTDDEGRILWQLSQLDDGGNLRETILGNGLTARRITDIATGRLLTIGASRGFLDTVYGENYLWDDAGNLEQRNYQRGSLITGDWQAWSESFTYDPLDRLQTTNLEISGSTVVEGPLTESFTYDGLGNLTQKGHRVGGYVYGEDIDGTRVRPHAVSQASVNGELRRYTYDANGNIRTAGHRTVTWTSFNKPALMEQGGNRSTFAYRPDRSRYRHVKTHDGHTVTTTYIGGSYERITSESKTTHRFNIRAGGQVIAVKELDTAPAHAIKQAGINTGPNTRQWAANDPRYHRNIADNTDILDQRQRFLHRDHLGSVRAITDGNGNTIEHLDFDAWGERRDLSALLDAATTQALIDDWSADIRYPGASYNPQLANYHRGFTGHEQLDHLELIQMNGRIYDPVIGRFLSADPFVQFPESTQGFNRYTYVGNNPLSYTDPSGYFLKKLVKGIVELNIQEIVGLVGVGLNFIPGCQFWCQVGYSALTGAVSGYMATGSVSGAIRGAAASAGLTAIGYGLSSGGQGLNSPTDWNFHKVMDVATQTVGVFNPKLAQKMAILNGFTYHQSNGNEIAGFQFLANEHIKQEVVRPELERFAEKNGMTLTEMNLVLEGLSYLGNQAVDSRYDKKNGHFRGWGNRGAEGLFFDAVDTILAYQGLPTASAIEYMNDGSAPRSIKGHSLGALDANNLVAAGFAESAELMALPLGAVSMSTNGSSTELVIGDPVVGGPLGWVTNPLSKKSPKATWDHSCASHTACPY